MIAVKSLNHQQITKKNLQGYDNVNEKANRIKNNLCSTIIEYEEEENNFKSDIEFEFCDEVSDEVQSQYRFSTESLTKQIENKASKDNCKPDIESTPKFYPNTAKKLNCEEAKNNIFKTREFLVKPKDDSSSNLKNMNNSKINNASLSLPMYNDKKLLNSNQNNKSNENVIDKNEFKSKLNNTKLKKKENCYIKYNNKNIKNNDDIIFNNFDDLNNYIDNLKDKKIIHKDNCNTNYEVTNNNNNSNNNNNNSNNKKISRKGCCVIF